MHSESSVPIRIITHNIRYATQSPFPGEARWKVRLPLIVSQFRYHTSHVASALLCLQEVLHGQLADLVGSLNSNSNAVSGDWASIGVGRDDGLSGGEYAAILYRSTVWKLLENDTVWLSETPRVAGSRSWDAASVRIVTIAVLRHQESGKEMVVLNTHLDDQGVVSRQKAAGMLRLIADDWSQDGKRAVVLTGDLNSEADGDAYKILTTTGRQRGFTMNDVRELSHYRYGDRNTFTGFEGKVSDLTRLDYVFTGQENGAAGLWKFDGYGVLPNRFEDGLYLSDHRAVVVDVTLE